MAANTRDQIMIDKVKLREVPVPWCPEFEKMISEINFKAGNSQIMLNCKLEIRKHLKSFNDDSLPDGCTLESLKCRRMAVAKLIFGKLGRSTDIEAPFFCTWGCNTFIGVNVYMNRNVSIFDSAPVSVRDRTLIGPDVCICTDAHEVDSAERSKSNQGSFAKAIRIGDDCWLGAHVAVLPGVTIGRGCTIAAGAVVAKDVEDNCLVGGVPATLIRRLK